MYCSACSKEILSSEKFCPHCGAAVGTSGVKSQEQRRTHPTLAIFLIALIVFVSQAAVIGAAARSSKDVAGINAVFGITYFFLFIAFLATLIRKPKQVVSTTVKESSSTDLKNKSGIGKWMVVIIFILGLAFLFINYVGNVSVSPVISAALVIVILAILVGLLWRFLKNHRETFLRAYQTIVKTIQFVVHHPILTIFSTIVLVILFLFIYSTFVQSNYRSLEKALPNIQDNLSEVATAKLMGDSIMAGYGVSNMWMGKIATTTKTTSDNLKQLSSPRALKSYKEVAISWSDSIAVAATKTATWKDLSETPAVFTLSLNDNKVNEYIETSLQKIAQLKEAGDIAIKRQDRPTMYYIAGQLLVQEYWLDGVMHSANPGTLSLKINLFPAALAWFPGPVNRKWMCTSRTVAARCGNANPVDLAKAIRQAAVEYAAAKPGADEQWNKVTADQLKVPTDQGQYTDAPGGVYNGEPNLPPQLSLTEKAFVDECKAKGGTTGGTGGVYARMPTTETGIACHHGNSCWDYLTRSNRQYSGGNQGCPEENLLPPPPPPSPTLRPSTQTTPQKSQTPQNPPSASWDGTYNLQVSGTCGLQNLGSYSSVSLDKVTVRNNRVYNNMGASAPIDSSGHAQISSSVSGGGMTLNYRQTFSFAGGGVQGAFDIPALSGVCSITYSGSRS